VTVTMQKIYVTCVVTDTHCVEVRVQDPPDFPTACGQTTQGPPGPDGTWSQRAIIYVRNSYNSYSQQYVNYILGHEFGHLFGLVNQSSQCIVSGSPAAIMNPLATGTCNGSMQGLTDSPQNSDAIPAAKSVYGSAGRTVCK
jgi:hypothetical protein